MISGSLAIVNYDLGGRSFRTARGLVKAGEARWAYGRLATLRLVPLDHKLADDEVFVEELLSGPEEQPGCFHPV